MLELTIPLPPSVNSLYRAFRGRTIMSKAGRKYRADGLAAVLSQDRRKFKGRVAVEIKVYPADKRRFDLDNRAKGILDLMTHAGIWNDDEQVDDLRIIRMPVEKPGKAIVRIEEMPREMPIR